MLHVVVGLPIVWTATSQSVFGAQLSDIRAQLSGNVSSISAQRALGYLWHMPASSISQRGLGGGITWAWDPELCDSLLDLFHEDLFFASIVTCNDLKAAMHRAMASWSANHQHIRFVDVTDECAVLYGETRADCDLVELWVTRREGESAGAVYGGEDDRVQEAASATPLVTLSTDFRYTNGVMASRPVVETNGGMIQFGVQGLCWYLDSTFCSKFHATKAYASTNSIKLLIQTALLAISGIAATVILMQLIPVFRSQCTLDKRERSCRQRMGGALEAIGKWSIVGNSLRLVMLVTPIMFYLNIFLPCWDCYDFESAAAHEVGHILGLGHPDRAGSERAASCFVNGVLLPACGPPGQNLYQPTRISTDMCLTSFDDATVGIPPGTDLLIKGVRPSVMISFTQNTPRVCLTDDDLEALNALYPDCEISISEPVCFKTSHNLGWIRVMVYMCVPCMLALIISLLLGTCTQKQQMGRIRHARELIRQKSANLRQQIAFASSQAREAEDARDKLRHEQESVTQRVETLVQHRVRLLTASTNVDHLTDPSPTPPVDGAAAAANSPPPCPSAPVRHGSQRRFPWFGRSGSSIERMVVEGESPGARSTPANGATANGATGCSPHALCSRSLSRRGLFGRRQVVVQVGDSSGCSCDGARPPTGHPTPPSPPVSGVEMAPARPVATTAPAPPPPDSGATSAATSAGGNLVDQQATAAGVYYDHEGYDRDGYDRDGYDRDGFNRYGY